MNMHKYVYPRTSFNGRDAKENCVRCGLPELHWIHEVEGCGFCLLVPVSIIHGEIQYNFMSRQAALKAGFHT